MDVLRINYNEFDFEFPGKYVSKIVNKNIKIVVSTTKYNLYL